MRKYMEILGRRMNQHTWCSSMLRPPCEISAPRNPTKTSVLAWSQFDRVPSRCGGLVGALSDCCLSRAWEVSVLKGRREIHWKTHTHRTNGHSVATDQLGWVPMFMFPFKSFLIQSVTELLCCAKRTSTKHCMELPSCHILPVQQEVASVLL